MGPIRDESGGDPVVHPTFYVFPSLLDQSKKARKKKRVSDNVFGNVSDNLSFLCNRYLKWSFSDDD